MSNPYQLDTKNVYVDNHSNSYIGSYNKSWFIEEDFLNNEFIDKFFSFVCDRCSGDLRDYILENRQFTLNLKTIFELIDKLDIFSIVLLQDFARYIGKYVECSVINDTTISYDKFSVILFNNNFNDF